MGGARCLQLTLGMDAIELLGQRYGRASRLLERLPDVSPPDRHHALDELGRELQVVMAIEELLLLPSMSDQESEDAISDHALFQSLLRAGHALAQAKEAFERCERALEQAFELHRNETETQLFPRLRRRLSEERLEELGHALTIVGHAAG